MTVTPTPTIDRHSIGKIIKKEVVRNGVFITGHAETRMAERRIELIRVERCITNGQCGQGEQDEKGRWSVRFEHRVAGDRLVVQAGLETKETGNIVVVITAYWE